MRNPSPNDQHLVSVAPVGADPDNQPRHLAFVAQELKTMSRGLRRPDELVEAIDAKGCIARAIQDVLGVP